MLGKAWRELKDGTGSVAYSSGSIHMRTERVPRRGPGGECWQVFATWSAGWLLVRVGPEGKYETEAIARQGAETLAKKITADDGVSGPRTVCWTVSQDDLPEQYQGDQIFHRPKVEIDGQEADHADD